MEFYLEKPQTKQVPREVEDVCVADRKESMMDKITVTTYCIFRQQVE